MAPEVSVVLPMYNEAKNVKEMVSQVLKHLPKAEVLVVDDDSPDLTWKIAEDMHDSRVKVIRRTTEKGVASAILTGLRAANAPVVAWMDADLSMPPSLLPKMIEQLKEVDVVVGSRYAKGGKDVRPALRVFTSRAINLAANIILNFKVKDYDSGFVVAKKEVVREIEFQPTGHGEYCIEFLFRASRKGYKIREVGFQFTDRILGESKTTATLFSLPFHGMRYLWRILKIRFKYGLR